MSERDWDVTVSDTIIAFGQGHFLRAVVVPVAEELTALSREFPPEGEDKSWGPNVNDDLRAGPLELAGLVGAVAFIATWAATKTLDDIYDFKVGPILRRRLGEYLRDETSTKKYGLSVLINKSPERVSILIASVGHSFAEIERGEKQIKSVLASSLKSASEFSEPGDVHLYIIESGQVNSHPYVYQEVSSALEHLREMEEIRPARPLPRRSAY